MTTYRCFSCNKEIKEDHIKKKVRCIYCGAKLIFKVRNAPTNLKAR